VPPGDAARPLRRTPLYPLHQSLGARMVPFAGYEMPVQYPTGILAEHLHTRAQAGLFDVSHMGQLCLAGADPAAALEALVPGDIRALEPMRMRYTLLLDDKGGILDDLMATRLGNGLFVVVNAACKDTDFAYLRDRLGRGTTVEQLDDRALLALQGPAAAAVLSRLADGIARMPFMTAAELMLDGWQCLVSRSGYTGEDGFEVSLPAADAPWLAERLLAEPEVMLIGLGARDSLRLEAGLCLYGHDIDQTTTPVEADLAWTIGKRRREEGRFAGAGVILRQLAEGAPRKRVGIRPDGPAPARETTPIVDAAGNPIGRVTSGGFGPSVGGPIAMGYVGAAHAVAGAALSLLVRGAARPARIAPLPFVPHRYYRGRPAEGTRR
jgi:glycine cleavage system T protein (aminomethyltransferase)